MEFVLIPTLIVVLIAVHELGHYLAGLTAGIPAGVMSVRLLTFPQHVALRDGDRWVSPVREIGDYIEVSRRYLATRAAAFRWVAGGLVLETAFTTVVGLGALGLGWRELAFWTVAVSLGMYLINVVLMDVPWALIHRHPFGDTSGLWQIAPWPAVVVTLAMPAIRALLLGAVLYQPAG